ncbi:MAG: DUF4411 family protein [Chromatiaceae bacterium]|nr:MAG: DUF4411 family protein [Chromatiaceae bacterium]
MTQPARTYLLDTNVFVEAHRRYYGFDICPGFWHWLLHHQQANHIVSIDRVRQELKTGDVLDQWIKDTAPSDLFHSTQDAAVIAHFASMMGWVQASTQFKPAAKSQFANVADGWLAAYAKAHGHVLVTHEEYAPDAKKSVPLPNVCKQFGIQYLDTFAMLRELQARFLWEQA